MPQPPLPLEVETLPALPPIQGLLDAAVGPLDMPGHGENAGMIWVPDTTGPGELYTAPCQTPPYPALTRDALDTLAQAWPWVAYASLETPPVGYSDAEATRRVRQRLLSYEQRMAEKAFWGGTATLFTGVTNVAGTTHPAAGVAGVAGGILQQVANAAPAWYTNVTGGTAVGLVEGISLLEQAAGAYCGPTLLHARPRLGAMLGFRDQLVPDPRAAHMTWGGSRLVLGRGYTGVGPANEAVVEANDATGIEWMWLTGRVVVWRSPDVWVSPPDQLLNRATNQRGIYAIRPYVIGVEGFVATAKIIRINQWSAVA